jgi:ribulose-phosphate 3-epimerase
MEYSLVPSLPAASFDELSSLAEKLAGIALGFQVDIVDGLFVPHKAWPFTETDMALEWEKLPLLTKNFEIEIDCMVREPEQYLDIFVVNDIPRVIIHVGSTECYGKCIRHARTHGYKIGFALTNDVPLSFMHPYVPLIDFVQVMGIAHVGRQGQPFDERTLATVRSLRDTYPDLEIAVDGSVNEKTIPLLKKAGVNRFAPGSAIRKAEDPAAAYKHLVSLIT